AARPWIAADRRLHPAQHVFDVDLEQPVRVAGHVLARLRAVLGFQFLEEGPELSARAVGVPSLKRALGGLELLPEAAADPGVRDPAELSAGAVEVGADQREARARIVERCRGAGWHQCVDLPAADRVEVGSLNVLQYFDDGVRHDLEGYRERYDFGATEHPRARRS